MPNSSDFLSLTAEANALMAAEINGFKRSLGEAYGSLRRFVLEVNGLTFVEGFRACPVQNLQVATES